ncbi:hypothetical protein JHK85_020861 [Glycine max]|uniref:Uncharacterized protein n=1 Tax=Glycine max TaxID=3847 RepID=K7L4V6_SOYBN|nr:hypothetical protein JHK85_020861 [Glycine max]KAH1049548.1 hypothetical protein GYH30_020184 [Glycine max]
MKKHAFLPVREFISQNEIIERTFWTNHNNNFIESYKVLNYKTNSISFTDITNSPGADEDSWLTEAESYDPSSFIILVFSAIFLRPKQSKDGPPGPPGFPVIGNLQALAQQYGPVMSLRLGQVPHG